MRGFSFSTTAQELGFLWSRGAERETSDKIFGVGLLVGFAGAAVYAMATLLAVIGPRRSQLWQRFCLKLLALAKALLALCLLLLAIGLVILASE